MIGEQGVQYPLKARNLYAYQLYVRQHNYRLSSLCIRFFSALAKAGRQNGLTKPLHFTLKTAKVV